MTRAEMAVLLLHLAVAFSALSFTAAHKCVHDKEIGPYHHELVQQFTSIRKEAHRHANPHITASRRSAAEVEPQPLRIKPIFQLQGLDPRRAAFLKDRLIPAAIDEISRAVRVRRPVQGNLVLPRVCSLYYQDRDGSVIDDRCAGVQELNTCGPYALTDPGLFGSYRLCPSFYRCTEVEGGPGMPGADYILYVTANDMDACSYGTVATGGFCNIDVETGRPLAGFANFCPDSLGSDENWGYQLDTAVHEIMHGLVMSEALFTLYRTPEGTPYPSSPVGQTGNGVYVVTTPEVKQAVRDHFDCPSAVGAALEDGGGEGTSASHWESRFFQNEIMQGASSPSSRQLLSRLTLALLSDSGWYETDAASGAEPSYGYRKGCGFLVESCVQSVVPDVFEGYYCPGQGIDAGLVMQQTSAGAGGPDKCSWDHQSISYCTEAASLTGTCRLVEPYSNGKCSVAANGEGKWSVSFGDVWGSPNSRCLPVESNQLRIRKGPTVYTLQAAGASCWEVECTPDGRVMVEVLGARAECPPGGTLDLSSLNVGILEGAIGPCPRPENICPFLGCDNGCSGNGICVRGSCQCFLGWQGRSCASPVCGATGGDPLCEALHGSGASCDLSLGACGCDNTCGLPDPNNELLPSTPLSGLSDPPLSSDLTLLPKDPREPSAELIPRDPELPDSFLKPASSPSSSPGPPPPSPPAPPAPKPPPSRPLPFPSSSPSPSSAQPTQDGVSPPPSPAPKEPSEPVAGPVEALEQPVERKYVLGKAFSGSGYLQDCTVFLSSDKGSRGPEDPSVQTDRYGGFYLSSTSEIPVAVELPSGGSCVGSFTGQPPVVPVQGPAGSTSLSPLSALVARLAAASSEASSSSPPNGAFGKAEAAVGSLLGVPGSSRIFEDDVVKLIAEGSTEEAPAFAVLSKLTVAVTVASAWLSAREDGLSQRMAASEAIMEALVARLEASEPVDFGSSAVVALLLRDAAERLSSIRAAREGGAAASSLQLPRNRKAAEAVAEAIARMSALLDQKLPSEEEGEGGRGGGEGRLPAGPRFLAAAGALARVAQGPVSREAAALGQGLQGPAEFAEMTSEERLGVLVLEEQLNGPDVYDSVEVPAPPPPRAQGRDFVGRILEDSRDFLLSNPWAMYACAATAAVLICILVCCCCHGCRRRYRERARKRRLASLREADELIDAENLARALELSMAPSSSAVPSNPPRPTVPMWQ